MLKSKLLKPIIVVLCLMMLSNLSRSQILISILLGDKLNTGAIEFGLTGGFNRNHIFGMPDAKGANNFNLGFYFDFKLKKEKRWFLYTGVLVKSTMGATIDVYSLDDPTLDTVFVGGSVERKINYFNVPVSIKYRFDRIFLLGGFQFGLRSKASDIFKDSYNSKDDVTYKQLTKDNYKRLDAGLTAGLGYKFKYGIRMNLGLRYYYGLVDIFREGPDYGTNSSLYIFAEIPIGADRTPMPPKEKKKKKKKKDK
jgi:hypothetical protein